MNSKRPINNECAQCRRIAKLKKSHIISKFVWDYLKDTSGAGNLRHGTNPNRPVQDGFKCKLLCGNCEQRFGVWENYVAAEIFKPLMLEDKTEFDYDIRFSKFCISIVWRILQFMQINGMPQHFSTKHIEVADLAERNWRAHLLEDKPVVKAFEFHAIPFGPIVDSTDPNAPVNLNRYLSRSVQMDVVSATENGCYVYAKLCRLVILGFINMLKQHGFVGTKIQFGSGSFGARQYVAPPEFGEYLKRQAVRMAKLQQNLSANQRKNNDSKIQAHADAIANSPAFEAMIQDYNLFGPAIFNDDGDQR